jgi:glycosyltransferase involved in cell wall biosynthesis
MTDDEHKTEAPNAGNEPRVAFLSPTFYAYRVPLFEQLNQRFRDRFLVIALASMIDERAWQAANMGSFPRRLINGVVIDNRYLTRRTHSGQKTPIGPTIAPGLTKVLRQFRPDIVISINLGLWTLTSIVLGYPTIIYWEGTAHTERSAGRTRMLLRRWMASRALAFVTNGKQSRDYVANILGARDDLIFQGGLGPESPPLHLAALVHMREHTGSIRFLFVGRLIPLKGVLHLLRATRILLDRGYSASAFQITVVGEGSERASLEDLSRQLGLDDIVHFEGGVGSSEVWKFYHACDVFVLPSLQDNWALVIPEAMSIGKAILMSKHVGSAPDLVHVGENGFTFDPEDHAELARLMSFYIDHPEAVAAQGSRSREIATEYTPAKVAQPYISAVDYAAGTVNKNARV